MLQNSKVLNWGGPNTYINDILFDYKRSSTYKGPTVTPYDTFHELPHGPVSNHMTHTTPPILLPTRKEHIDTTLDEQFVSTRGERVEQFFGRGREDLNPKRLIWKQQE